MLIPQEIKWLQEVKNKQVCVLGSGDNLVVFALAGMGAAVTSVDISEAQLENAERRARELELNITFQCADVADLAMIADRTFDFVYTGGHVAVWVADLQQYYGAATRILQPGGLFLINEYHPFRRIWADPPDALSVKHSYFNRGPHCYEVAEGLFDEESGDIPSYEFNWTIADYVNAVMKTDSEILRLKSMAMTPKASKPPPWEGCPIISCL